MKLVGRILNLVRLAWQTLLSRVVHRQASTRVLGLLRIGLCTLFFVRFSTDFILYRHLSLGGLSAAWAIGAISFAGSTTLLLLGLFTPLARVWNLFTVSWMVVVIAHGERMEPWLHHHTSLLFWCLGLLSLTPCGHSFSLDRLRQVNKAWPHPAPPERGPIFGQWLIAMQASAVYFWGAFDKCNLAYLSGARLEHHLCTYFTYFETPDAWWLHLAAATLAVSSVLLEFTLAFGLFFRRLWWPLAACGVFFHLVIYFTLPVATFSAHIVFLYLAFQDPDRFHRAIDRLLGRTT